MQKKQIDLTVIIISLSTEKYHTKNILQVTLKSMVSAMSKISTELILVDNSTIDDGTFEMAKRYFPNVNYLKRDKVYGFGDNNNFGLKKAKGKYILFLNNDMKIIDDNVYIEMIKWMDNNPKVGVSSSALINQNERTLQASGGSFPSLFRVFAWMTFLNNSYHPDLNYYDKKHSQDWVTGAFYLVKKSILDKIGGFDEDFEAYVEEVDLSYRIKKIGFEIMYLPQWRIIHYGSQSYGSENSLIFELKNLKLFYKKHYPAWQLPILNLIIKLGCVLRIIAFSIFKPSLVKIYAKAIKTV